MSEQVQSFLAHVLLVTVSHILLVTEKLQSGTGPSQGGELPPSQPKKKNRKGKQQGHVENAQLGTKSPVNEESLCHHGQLRQISTGH